MERRAVRISLIDDDPSFLRALRRLLDGVGFTVSTFGSAEEFLASGEAPVTSCLVLDIHLGGMSGLDLEQRLVASGTPIPTVFVSGLDDARASERARSAGLYLRKPFREDALIGAIRRAIGQTAAGSA